MTDAERDRAAQIAEFLRLVKEGWTLYPDDEWQKIAARYKDLDLAGQVPRPIMFFDIGVLISRIALLERVLLEHTRHLRKLKAQLNATPKPPDPPVSD